MALAERTVTEEIPAPPNEVRAFYVDLDNIKRVHPLVVAVRTTDRHQTADGYVQTYRVQPIAAGTRVTEHMRIEAPRVLAAMTTSEAVKAHTAMLAGMRRSFE